MPRYFFDLYNDVDAMDLEGRDLSDLDAAKDTALSEAREMIRASVGEGKINLCHRIEARDDSGAIVCVMRFEDAVKILHHDRPRLVRDMPFG